MAGGGGCWGAVLSPVDATSLVGYAVSNQCRLTEMLTGCIGSVARETKQTGNMTQATMMVGKSFGRPRGEGPSCC